jgi:hypothetical protein
MLVLAHANACNPNYEGRGLEFVTAALPSQKLDFRPVILLPRTPRETDCRSMRALHASRYLDRRLVDQTMEPVGPLAEPQALLRQKGTP